MAILSLGMASVAGSVGAVEAPALGFSSSLAAALPAAVLPPEQLPKSGFAFAPVPDWVRPVLAFDPELPADTEVVQGYQGRLRDFQYNGIKVGQSSYFTALEYRLTNRYGVENHSSIEISFDPSYERLFVHELWIKRGDERVDKLSTARFDLLRTEADRAELIYDGTRTLAIVLDDVRSGDTVRYSYSVAGENPIYEGHREFRVNTEVSTPLARQSVRILTSSDRPFNRRVRGDDWPVQITEEAGIQELLLEQRDVPEFSIEDDVPNWHYNRGTMVFSDMQDWRSVVEWAAPMYKLEEQASAQIATIASVIRASSDDRDEQIGAALRWVQDEIRYFGVELGKNSHWPSRPAETLERRFGDCKDKALLLITLLKELGVEAQAALVNTDRGLESASYPYRLHAFNHVIVHLLVDGQVHFIDPTLSYQAGALGQLREPDYGRALVLAAGTTGLVEMSTSQVRYRMSINKKVELLESSPDNAVAKLSDTGSENGAGKVPANMSASLQVTTMKQGGWAENVRHSLESDGVRQLARAYESYYADYFDRISATDQPEFIEAEGDGVVIEESYRIPDFWVSDGEVERYRWIHADEIMSYLDLPARTSGRQQPYGIVHPIIIEESWDVTLPYGMRLEDLNDSVETPWMRFSKQATVNEQGTHVNVKFRYQTLSNEVAAVDLVDYAAAVTRIDDLASFYIEDEPPAVAAAIKVAGYEVSKAGMFYWWMLAPGLAILLLRIFRARAIA
ncbi:DUF3857 domain-containing protein [Granulosicoccus antarcticus]|nr:DUF3857 domain-containing protein [Granulosicoccus antarcticus]